MYVCAHMCMYGDQRTVCQVRFSPSTIRVPGITFMLSDLTASVLTTEPPLLSCAFFLPERPNEWLKAGSGDKNAVYPGVLGPGWRLWRCQAGVSSAAFAPRRLSGTPRQPTTTTPAASGSSSKSTTWRAASCGGELFCLCAPQAKAGTQGPL